MIQQLTPNQLEQLFEGDLDKDTSLKQTILEQEHLSCKLFLLCERNDSKYTREMKSKLWEAELIVTFFELDGLLKGGKNGFIDMRRYLDIRKQHRHVSIEGITKNLKFPVKQFSILDGRFFDMELFSEFIRKRYTCSYMYVSSRSTMKAFRAVDW